MWPPQQILQQQILQRLPTFRRDNDYSDEADPYKASLKHTLKLYRYHANREESEFNGWKHVDVDKRKRAVEHPSIKIVSWNIDFEAHNVVERATAALKYLKEERFGCKLDTDSPGPCVIMLQEVHAKALRDAIRTNEWVRHNFFITPVDHLKWPKIWMHGNVTLVERSVAVRDAYCLEYGLSDQTRMAVVLNITLRSADKLRHVTLINTQLDDLPGLERHRRRQLRECAKVLEGSESGGIIAGGMSIYSSEDDVGEELLRELKLYDTGGCDDSDKSLTWGFQGGRGSTKSRPDKIMSYTPPNHRRKLLVTPPKRLGMGLKWYPGNTFVSDHYGLMATVEVRG